ncbi:hypothetical protein JTB14_000314 [Gonioctena quinquepunctata]|nr:hypothetical protein JTB14_000314 [Gonioctena quinquepunctata]
MMELKEYILKAPGGKKVFYRTNKTLDDKHRKRLVNIVVNHMLQGSSDLLPSNNTKAAYASAIVHLFPALKDNTTEDGFVSFFDPVSTKGFLTNRIRTLCRG